MQRIKQLKTCQKGHKFYKSSDCPTCPICVKDVPYGEFPIDLSRPAVRALLSAGITKLKDLSKYTEKEILELHGIGPTAIPILKNAMHAKNITFKNI